jgi:hypothetical protein
MRVISYLLLIGFLLITNTSLSQSEKVGYKGGEDKLIANLKSYLIKYIYRELDSNLCVIAVVEINRNNQIENVLLTSFGNDSLYSTFAYKAIMKTKNNWINGTMGDLFFEFPFIF